MIQFSEEIGLWSEFTFWYVSINMLACFLFTIVVIIGGILDIRYLFNSLKKEQIDEADDGRVNATTKASYQNKPASKEN